jgi:hypothetical protein
MADTSSVSTDPRVQVAWGHVLDALNAYGVACLQAATDPAPVGHAVLMDRVDGATLNRHTDDQEVLWLRVLGPRGTFTDPLSLAGKRVAVYSDD